MSLSAPLGKILPFVILFCAACHLVAGQDIAPPPTTPPSESTSPSKADPPIVKIVRETPAQSLMRSASQATRNRDYSTGAQLLEKLVSIDPDYPNAWNYLGWTYNSLGEYTKAEVALRSAITRNPQDPSAHNNLGQSLAYQKRYDEAISEYLKQIEIRPKDSWAYANLGRVYIATKQYPEAKTALETAATLTPDDPTIPFNLGRVYAKLNEPEEATKSFAKSAEMQPVPSRWNAVAYQLALDKLDLTLARKYSLSAIAATAISMRETSLDHLTREDSYQTSRISAMWDTWGWIRFQENNLTEAEKYVKSAWDVRATAVIGDHLGQISEKQGHKTEAIRSYQMALAVDPTAAETRDRLASLVGPGAKLDAMIDEGHALLKESQTITIKNSRKVEGFAEFWLLLSPGPTVRGVKFITGDEELAPMAKDLESVAYPDYFPEATELKLLRRARLACIRSSADCHLQMISSQAVPTSELAATPTSVNGELGSIPPGGRVRLGGTIAAGHLTKRVQPVYPLLARQTRIEGDVKLHAIIAQDGTVQQLQVISGHPLLVQAALDAVKQWEYQPTLLEGKPVEVDTEIDVFFALQKNGPQK